MDASNRPGGTGRRMVRAKWCPDPSGTTRGPCGRCLDV